MSPATSGTLKARFKPALKSPLRASTMSPAAPLAPAIPGPSPSGGSRPSPELTPRQLRKLQIGQYTSWLRTQTNKHKRPFQEQTLVAYTETARALDGWMAEEYIDGDFTACDTAVLNRFFADYRNAHGQGGTNIRQRDLHPLFKWLETSHGHPDPWTDDLVRYSPVKSRPSALAQEFIRDLLEVTGGGKARLFADVRDRAMIRMLTEGVRREELAQQQILDVSDDLVARPFVRVVPLKGARDFSEGRLVPLMMASAQALSAYLRVAGHTSRPSCPHYGWAPATADR